MPRYIDAEKLTEALREKCDGCKDKWTDYCTTCCDVEQLIEMIDNADDVDIVEKKKGKWILSEEQRQEDVDNGNYRFICSECGKCEMHSKVVTVSFCWNCGADMRPDNAPLADDDSIYG